MHNIIQWRPGKGGADPSRPDADVRTDVLGILKKIPQNEDGWARGMPQTDEDVAALFCKLTLTGQYPPARRKMMACPDLITELAKTLDSSNQLDIMTLIDACEVGVKQGELSLSQARNLVRLRVDKPDKSLDGMRWGTQRFIRMLDELHTHGAVGTRVYEVAIRRPNALFRLANFTERHMQTLLEECRNIYRPQSQLDSTCLRVPNIVYVLFAGRFRAKIHHQLTGSPCRVDSFAVTISLDKALEEDRKMASRDVVGLAPILQGPDPHDFTLSDSLPKLVDCLETKGGGYQARTCSAPLLTSRKRSLIISIAESRGWRIMNMNDWNHQLFRLLPLASLPVSEGHIGAAMLLTTRGWRGHSG
ncbi:hypothetical protein CEP51_016131 [Fusarium floridanum]|uniref:Uncharacterized protein n=1 Tax=Fusarium floridanum TaxID=1325733 RepID=A0A428NWG8_9HYPO|nr:hypothetical protein CEP51_016131 [Fusarium floridanum]